jgi:hypothetical protein
MTRTATTGVTNRSNQNKEINGGSSTITEAEDPTATFYQFDVANLPDALFHAHVPAEEWLATCETTEDTKGFPANSLNELHPIGWDVELERIVGFTLYQFLNILPFLILPLLILYFGIATPLARGIVWAHVGYVAILGFITGVLEPVFLKKYGQTQFLLADIKDVKRNQYVSLWLKASLESPACMDKSMCSHL